MPITTKETSVVSVPSAKIHRGGDVGRHPENLQRQGVAAARGQQGAGKLVVADGEAKQGHAKKRWRDDRQNDMEHGLPGACALVAGGVLIRRVKAVEDGEHHQQAEHDRAAEAAPDIANRLGLEHLVEPVQRHALHREGHASARTLKAEDAGGDRPAIEKQHVEAEEK